MFEKVNIKEIKAIMERLEIELEDKSIVFRRREEVRSLIYFLNSWLEWRDYRKREHYREATKKKGVIYGEKVS